MLSTAILQLLAAPVLIAVLGMAMLDRTAQTTFFIPSGGGSPYLYQNLFWVFGHPEVYILALPGFAIVLELLPVFARKPLWGYRLAVAGMLGVTLLSWLVWQHHLFVSGINSDLRPFYMLSTELISIPTGFTFLCGLMTLWRGQIRFTVPMLFCLAWFFNFLIGGLSGVFLSDVPSDVTTHGSFFSMAHFHYTIMGGLVFTFFAAIYYWVPKMTGFKLNERLGKIHFWTMFIAFNSTFAPLFAVGFLGQPRRVVTYPHNLQFLNDWVSVSAFVLGAVDARVPLQLRLLARLRARAGAAEPVGVAVARVAASLAGARAQLRPDPGDHRRSRTTTAIRRPVRSLRRHRPEAAHERARRARDRLRGRRGRAARAPRAQPQLGRAPARERDGLLLPRVRLRLLLSPLAEQRRGSGIRSTSIRR